MALTSPENKLWWNQKLHTPELVWIGIAFLWGVIMFLVMVFWHITGTQNLSNEAYRVIPEKYAMRAEASAEQFKVREDKASGMPVVHPPPGGDAYLIARLWEWWPILELEKGKQYRLHLSSLDWMHGFSLQPANINIQVHPKYEMIITITPDKAGDYGIVCNEFCGIGHHQMLGKIIVVDKK